MKAIKNNLIPITSVCTLVLISVASVFISFAGSNNITRTSMSIVMGMVMICGIIVIKEEYLHKAALIVYLGVVGVLCVQLYISDKTNYISMRFLELFDMFAIYTAAFLPLTYIQSAKMIGKHETIGFEKLLAILVVMIIPMNLVIAQINMHPVIIAFLVSYITVIIMKREKKINVPWLVLLIPLVLIVIAAVYMFTSTNYASMRLDTILTRGQNDPLGAGWTRTNLDGILMNTPVLGETHYVQEYCPIVDMLSNWGGYNIVILLAKCGWLVFLAALVLYVCFFIGLFKMVQKTKQSSFAKYTSLMFALSLFVQAVYSLVGVFLLDSSPVDMPFISNNYTLNVINYLSFGIVFSLYLGRNKVSTIKEIDVEESLFDDPQKGLINSFKEDI